MRVNNGTLGYMADLKMRLTLPEAMPSLRELAIAQRDELPEIDDSKSRALNGVKDWLINNSRFVQVSNAEQEQKWEYFTMIVEVEGLSKAVDWFYDNCMASLVGAETSPWEIV